jgi:large subunit ribosomal protein L25
MARFTLAAKTRDQKGKQAAKRLRRENRLPAIFYGPGASTMMLTVDYKELDKIITKTSGENVIIGLQIESEKGSDSKIVILKELHSDPVKRNYLHADFYEISMDKELTLEIALHFINIPKGVVNGGMLQPIRRELTVSCLPDKMVDFIEVDVSGLDIGQSLHIREITLPDGLKSELDPDLPIATVIAPSAVAAEAGAGEEKAVAAEGKAAPEASQK